MPDSSVGSCAECNRAIVVNERLGISFCPIHGPGYIPNFQQEPSWMPNRKASVSPTPSGRSRS